MLKDLQSLVTNYFLKTAFQLDKNLDMTESRKDLKFLQIYHVEWFLYAHHAIVYLQNDLTNFPIGEQNLR